MKRIYGLVSVCCLGFLGLPAVAQDQELPNFATIDTNSDGFLSSEELSAAGVTLSTDEVDQNDDDLISRMEYQALVNSLNQG